MRNKIKILPGQNVFFTSDSHYNHEGLVRGTSKWDDVSKCRDFDSLDVHNDVIVDNINSRVGSNDILFHLGDWSFGGFERIQEFRDRIKCKNIHLILGNHDQHIENNKENIQKIFTSVQYYLEISIGKQFIVMSHWPMKVWNHGHKGAWQLHGHCHNSLQPDNIWLAGIVKTSNPRRTMDIGLDTNNLDVYSFTELQEIMSKRPITVVDHHTLTTLS